MERKLKTGKKGQQGNDGLLSGIVIVFGAIIAVYALLPFLSNFIGTTAGNISTDNPEAAVVIQLIPLFLVLVTVVWVFGINRNYG